MNFTGPLLGDVTGNQSATVVSFVGGQTAAAVASTVTTVNSATNANIPNALVKRDGSGNFSAGTITASLNGNATTATTATTANNFTGPLLGDVTGNQSATVVSFVGGQSAANVASATVAANAATSVNTPNTIVKRDASGNFSAGTITANLSGAATSAVTTTNFTGPLVGDVTGTQSATVVSFVGGQTAANVASGTIAANAATNLNTPSTIVKRDGSGNFSAGTITASLSGNATTATTSTNFSGSLLGDVTGTQTATVVSSVGGQSAANVASATVAANAATSVNTPNTIVKRDASGNFSAGTITASLSGAASNNVLKSGDTMTGTLTHPAGTAANPSIQFSGSTNSGFSAATTNTLSFDTNGVERMAISTTAITLENPAIFTNVVSLTSVQTAVPVNNGTGTANAATSVFLLNPAATVPNFTVVFPASPINGQLFSIVLGTSNTLTTITNNGNGATVVNGITGLSLAALGTSTGGTSVTYIYLSSTNSWYRYHRG